ncbi:aldo/keto reductase [Pseudemcibacter aquimaris]|uniref:aldo/keto reductase n=1 Tax=Pseudemcibacter aquimaris TaxID=2857064 RepID=UPI00201320AE|nr:aldo/keto reductase [Pseudemcibacter aquimaris]MCC3860379.1 aldo/keto reductase [Pseudemcibacter aquimaris]WDU57705.1 aldo/keto reductase [Pseudemcibacter aquimaris]
MTDLTRKEFLKLTGAAAATGALAATGLGASVANAQSSDLLHRPIHSSGEMIPAVGLGTAMTFGDLSQDFNQRKNAIAALFREGATVIDTSPTYSNAEQVVGRALDELGARDKCFLATKISIMGKQEGIDQNNKSFEDLRTNKMELLQVHNLKDTDAHLDTINGLREEGKVKYVGITHFRDSLNDEAAKVIENNKIDFIQCHYNLLNQSIENRVLPAAREHGVAVMVNVPFARGRLFGPTAGAGIEIPEWSKDFGVDSWGKFFLKYILGREEVTVIIPGTVNDYHVVDNVGALRGRLPTETERKRMVDFIEAL